MALPLRLAVLLVLIALSVVVTLSFHRHGQPLREVNAIQLVVTFESPRPWVTRVFPTIVVKALVALTPQAIRARVTPESRGYLIGPAGPPSRTGRRSRR